MNRPAARPPLSAPLPPVAGSPRVRRGSYTFIGNATALIRFGDLTLLTDPNFLHRGQRAYLGHGITSKRLLEPALSVDELPALDAIVLSHLHGDHWDRVAQRGLDRDLPILTTPHAAKRLQLRGFARATGLRTWGAQEMVAGSSRVRITALPGRHAPRLVRSLLPPVMGSMLEFGPLSGEVELRLYVSGDTLLVDELSEIPTRFPQIDTGVLHLGGTRLPGVRGGLLVTMDARQGADLLDLLAPSTVIPVHNDDYGVMTSPLEAFLAEVERRGVADRVQVVGRGETIDLYSGGGPRTR